MMVLAIIFGFISSGFNGLMDFLMWYPESIPWDRNYWDPYRSYYNKYVDGDTRKGRIKWCWGLINKPVAFTDGWHLMKWFRNRFLEACMFFWTLGLLLYTPNNPWIWLGILRVVLLLGILLVVLLLGFFVVYNLLKWKYKKE